MKLNQKNNSNDITTVVKKINGNYDLLGMTIITILLIAGLVIIFMLFGRIDYDIINNYDYIVKNVVQIIIASFFIFVGLLCWIKFFQNVIINPKEGVLYLKSIRGNTCTFCNKRGKKYIVTVENIQKLNICTYYNVMKTADNITRIINISNKTFPLSKLKKSFWLNWYTPFGKKENIFLLPIIYLFFIIEFVSFWTLKKINLTFAFLSLFLICYDIAIKAKSNIFIKRLFRIKDNNVNSNRADKKHSLRNPWIEKSVSLSEPTLQIISGIIFDFFCIWMMKDTKGNIKFVIIPFLMAGLAILFNGIISFKSILNEINTPEDKMNSDEFTEKTIKYNKLLVFSSKFYIISFLLFLFGFLTLWCYLTIKEGSYLMALLSIPLWIVGIIIGYKNLKKN